MPTSTPPCAYCGAPTTTRWCSAECRVAHHNLRRLRGAAIYDLLMLWGSSYRERSALTDIGRTVRRWHREDAERGRRTWSHNG